MLPLSDISKTIEGVMLTFFIHLYGKKCNAFLPIQLQLSFVLCIRSFCFVFFLCVKKKINEKNNLSDYDQVVKSETCCQKATHLVEKDHLNLFLWFERVMTRIIGWKMSTWSSNTVKIRDSALGLSGFVSFFWWAYLREGLSMENL